MHHVGNNFKDLGFGKWFGSAHDVVESFNRNFLQNVDIGSGLAALELLKDMRVFAGPFDHGEVLSTARPSL